MKDFLSVRSCFWFNRWATFVASFFTLFCGGTAYLYSAYSEDVKNRLHLEQDDVGTLGVSFYFSQLGGLVLGVVYDRFGPRPLGWLSAACLSLGYLFFNLGVQHYWPTPALIFGLLLVGFGSMGTYTATIGPNIANFDAKHKGKVVGILAAMYGGAAAILSKVYKYGYQSKYPDKDMSGGAILDFSWFLALHLGAISAIGFIFINIVPKVEIVDHFSEESPLINQQEKDEVQNSYRNRSEKEKLEAYPESSFTQTLLSLNFYLLLTAFVIGVGVGAAVFANVAQFSVAIGHPENVSNLVMMNSIFNSLARPFWGIVSDLLARWISRPAFLALMLFVYILNMLLYSFANDVMLYMGVVMTGLCYGGVYVLIPVLINELFGAKHWGINYAIANCGPAIGNYGFSKLMSAIYKKNSPADSNQCHGLACFQLTFWIYAVICAGGFAAAVILWLRTRRLYRLKWEYAQKVITIN